jgi:myo-inositol 2-dehydrogenase / D-chiro-inositol 1-dehydrogenase
MSDDSRTRRDFIRSSAVATGVLAAGLRTPPVHAAGGDEIGIGLVGCGGRGRGAAADAVKSSPGVRVVAVGDAFPDRVAEARERLKELGEAGVVPDERAFVGLDAYQKVIATPGVNYVILATPPGFRPLHLEAAVAAGKNVFTEKPVAVDGPGIRSVLATYEAAKAKGLHVGAGTQRRHEAGYVEALKRVHDGGIGEVLAARAYWNQGALWNKPRQASWSDVEWQMRNWLYFTWLSGDHIVEQHVHNLDVANWALGAHPVRAMGMGGRQSRISPEYGHGFDHFAIDYEYPNGVHVQSMCRQIPDCANRVAESVVGTKGTCELESGAKRYELTGPSAYKFTATFTNPYVQEHADLIAAIRGGQPYNELKQVAESTLTAIMGRISAYTGKAVTWEEALGSSEALVPTNLAFGPMPVAPVARPGQVT